MFFASPQIRKFKLNRSSSNLRATAFPSSTLWSLRLRRTALMATPLSAVDRIVFDIDRKHRVVGRSPTKVGSTKL